jgi:hypothetical protein
MKWHILTGEYPPQPGGVSDYTRMVAHGLSAAGDDVTVWAPFDSAQGGQAGQAGSDEARVTVRWLPDRFGPRSLYILSRELRSTEPRRLLVQYVPHAFGWKAANLGFCLWLRSRGRGQEAVWVMFHEVAFPFDRDAPVRLNLLAGTHRLMARLVGGAAQRAFVSIPAWRPGVESVTPARTPVAWLPVPSGIPLVLDDRASAAIHARYGNGHALVGHFGTYGRHMRSLLAGCIPALAARCDCRLLLLGRDSEAVAAELTASFPVLAGRLHGAGALFPDDVSRHVSACDVMLQPYPDGISSRRTSAMAALSHARPVVTTSGPLTEDVWATSGAAVLVPVADAAGLAEATAALATNPERRARLAEHARALYRDQFALPHTIATLRSGT